MSTRPDHSPARDAALVAIFAGFVAALGIVPAFTPPGFTVPITTQSLGVMLAGAVLGARRGFLSLTLFLALVAVGLPLLAGGRGGESAHLSAWLVGAWQGMPTNVAPDEHDEIRWFEPEELPPFAHELLGTALAEAMRGARA